MARQRRREQALEPDQFLGRAVESGTQQSFTRVDSGQVLGDYQQEDPCRFQLPRHSYAVWRRQTLLGGGVGGDKEGAGSDECSYEALFWDAQVRWAYQDLWWQL